VDGKIRNFKTVLRKNCDRNFMASESGDLVYTVMNLRVTCVEYWFLKDSGHWCSLDSQTSVLK
jgi:hypothetical protein